MKSKYIFLLTVIFFFVLSNVSFSQKDTSDNKKGKYKETVRIKLIEEAGFSESQADKLLSISSEFRKERKELNKLKDDLLSELETEQESANIESILNKLLDTEKKICETRINYLLSLKEFLSPLQISKALVLQKKIKNILKEQKNTIKTD